MHAVAVLDFACSGANPRLLQADSNGQASGLTFTVLAAACLQHRQACVQLIASLLECEHWWQEVISCSWQSQPLPHPLCHDTHAYAADSDHHHQQAAERLFST